MTDPRGRLLYFDRADGDEYSARLDVYQAQAQLVITQHGDDSSLWLYGDNAGFIFRCIVRQNASKVDEILQSHWNQ